MKSFHSKWMPKLHCSLDTMNVSNQIPTHSSFPVSCLPPTGLQTPGSHHCLMECTTVVILCDIMHLTHTYSFFKILWECHQLWGNAFPFPAKCGTSHCVPKVPFYTTAPPRCRGCHLHTCLLSGGRACVRESKRPLPLCIPRTKSSAWHLGSLQVFMKLSNLQQKQQQETTMKTLVTFIPLMVAVIKDLLCTEMFVCMCLCVPHACLAPKEARRGHRIP